MALAIFRKNKDQPVLKLERFDVDLLSSSIVALVLAYY